jgi:O-antigen ligase
VPLLWLFVIGSRLPSQWLGGLGASAEAFEEGSPLDRAFYFLLILLALCILVRRSFDWGKFVASNLLLTAFLSFTLLSVFWSDFPFISIKRWFRDLGTYLIILVALSDPRPLEAVCLLLRRLSLLLIPLSIVLIKYFPQLAKGYDPWTGQGNFIGVTTSKNVLGLVCLVSGLFLFWDTVTRWINRKNPGTRKIIAINLTLFAMTLWLVSKANSATSSLCLVLGCLVITAAHTRIIRHRPVLLTILIPVGICLYLLLEFLIKLNLTAMVAEAVGRGPDLTGRPDVWKVVLATNINPYVGAGYESFWLGSRLLWVWERLGTVNQAHNGYLEVYLNLGFIGLFLLSAFLIASYRTICRRMTVSASHAALALALWTVLLAYNVTEAAFKGHPLWAVFLLWVILVPPARREGKVHERRGWRATLAARRPMHTPVMP